MNTTDDNRENYLIELYNGITLIKNPLLDQIPYAEFKTRMQNTSSEELRKIVLELRRIRKLNK